MIYFTSFARSRYLPEHVWCYSAAVYQPKGYDFSVVDLFSIVDSDGKWIRPGNFAGYRFPLDRYREALMGLYDHRRTGIEAWVRERQGDVALLCWCPYERATRKQLEEFGSFVCHLSVIGRWLSVNMPEQQLWFDSDRLSMAVLEQKYDRRQR